MHVTPAVVRNEYEWTRDRAPEVVTLINDVRTDLGEVFGRNPAPVSEADYLEAVDEVFGDGDLAVNVAALIRLLRPLDVDEDYPGFVVDEILARELAGMVSGTEPLRVLGEATFHYADVTVHVGETAGADDLYAALAAGFQTRLPGWAWRESEDVFAVDE
ncbi:MAG: hypothetical protein V5A43_04775 [Haloarculaceae archaeon]